MPWASSNRPTSVHAHFSLRPNEGRKVTMMQSLEKHCDASLTLRFSGCTVPLPHMCCIQCREPSARGKMATTIVKQSKDRRGAARK